MSELRVNNITNRDGKRGTVVAGIPQVTSTSHFVPSSGRTGQRYADGGENIVRDGLVLHLDAKYSYPSNTGITSTTASLDPDVYNWYDMSGYENNGELVGGVGYNVANGGSLVFDGSNDYVDCGYNSSLDFGAESFTLSCWVKTNQTGSTLMFLSKANGVAIASASSRGYMLYLGNGGTNWIFGVWSGDPNNISPDSSSLGTVLTNTWYNVTGVHNKDRKNVTLYVNGSFTSERIYGQQTFANTSVTNRLYIGSGQGSTGSISLPWNGSIATTSIYNRALTAAEVLQNYNALKDRFGL